MELDWVRDQLLLVIQDQGNGSHTTWWDLLPRQKELEPLIWGGTLQIPCLESSANTLSVDGGLRPKGKGSHGLLIASFTTLSITSSACINQRKNKKKCKFKRISFHYNSNWYLSVSQCLCYYHTRKIIWFGMKFLTNLIGFIMVWYRNYLYHCCHFV